MAGTPEDERDDEFFKEVYGKEYTGPPKLSTEKQPENNKSNKRSHASVSAGGESDEEEQPRDPNAVPTDFTSREARVWEAKSKAIERNWKRKKEEELNCKICGESGHFAQGCPTTLGSNRTSREFVEKIPLRDKRLKPRIIGSGGSVIQRIEKDTGCRIRLEDNLTAGDGSFFVRISGPDRLCLVKGTNAVKKLVNEAEDEGKNQSSRQSRSSHRGFSDENPPIAAPTQHVGSQRHHSASESPSHLGSRNSNEEKHATDHIFSHIEGRRKFEGSSSQGRSSPNSIPSLLHKAERGSYQRHGQAQERGMYEGEMWAADPRVKEFDAGFKSEQHAFPKALEELEQEFLKEAMQLFGGRSAEEDEENMKHRAQLREIRDAFQKSMIALRARQASQWEEFMRREAHAPQRQYHQQAEYGHQSYSGLGNAGYGGVGGHGPYGENASIEPQSRFSASYDIYQGSEPNHVYGGKPPYNSGVYGNPQTYRSYR
eukprot:Gb_25679 [translate_table: standard]